MKQLLALLSLSFLLLTGCATNGSYGDSAQRIEYGTVTQLVLRSPDHSGPINLGTIVGGAAGGVIGHQFGGGSGKTALTIAGAVGGAVAGSQIQKATEKDRYEITVRLDSGADMIVNQVAEGELRVGDRVRIVNNRVYRN